MDSCPSISCTVLRSAPPCTNAEAKECLNVCGLMFFSSLILSARFLMMVKIITLLNFLPLLFRNTTFSNPFSMTSFLREFTRYFLISSIALLLIGTSLSRSPFPAMRRNSCSKCRFDTFRSTSSETRNPQLYRVSRIALLRSPSALVTSMASIRLLISSSVRISGSLRPILGDSRRVVGSFSTASSISRNL